ncbi:hypothetical protein C2E23DRAFT_889440 [Lenzites betulinus]|nr:hypothetical protein C2E23DRAFT_889440 [Lenzites betulinus]
MSARTPFVPQRSASRAANPDPPDESFRPNGLLDAPPADEQHAGPLTDADGPASAAHSFASKFKPLNLASFSKKNQRRPSVDRTAPTAAPAPKPAQLARLGSQRALSPFFHSSGAPSAPAAFKAPAAPAQTSGHPDDLSSNQAHTVSSARSSVYEPLSEISLAHGSGSDRFSSALDASFASHRSRTASQPSLASIHEVAEEDDEGSPRKLSPAKAYSDYPPSGAYTEDSPQEEPHGLRRSGKRPERAPEDDDEYEYGTGAKRYKPAPHQNEHPGMYNGRSTPAHYGVPAQFSRAPTPAHGAPLLAPPAHFLPEPVKVEASEARQALYRLLGQDLDIFVEGHADAYEQARKKWAECSVEDWTSGADDLAGRFGKMLDFVKEHMTSKLALYAALHKNIAEHKNVLSEREQALKEARESLVREGGAVVSGPSFGTDA